MVRAVPSILPAPWLIPRVVELSPRERLEWRSTDWREVSVADGRALARLLDEFSHLARPVRPADARHTIDAAREFSRDWGPWGACASAHGLHEELTPAMNPRPNLPAPPGVRRSRWERQDLRVVTESARRVNALRTLMAQLRLGKAPDPLALRALLTFRYGERAIDGTFDANRLVAAGAEAVKGEIDRFLTRWIDAVHVEPAASGWQDASSPFYMSVGGSAGAIAVAVLAERSGPPRTAVCGTCKTPWSVWKSWEESMVLGSEKCRSCKGAGYGVTWRRKAPKEFGDA